MKKLCFVFLLLCATAGLAMPIASSARALVPADLQQLIGVDYRALKGIGIDTDKDVDQLTFASFRSGRRRR